MIKFILLLIILIIQYNDSIFNDTIHDYDNFNNDLYNNYQQRRNLLVSDKFDDLADTGNYTCDALIRWLGSEKHYSNNKKDILFGLLANKDCSSQPVLLLDKVSFGWTGITITITIIILFYNNNNKQ